MFGRISIHNFEMCKIFQLGTNFCNFLLKQKKIDRKENVIFSNVIACTCSYTEGGNNKGVLQSTLIKSELNFDINQLVFNSIFSFEKYNLMYV